MSSLLKAFFFMVMVSLILAPATFAWNPNTHYEIVENNYNAMPADVQQKLSLKDMKDGADDPDFKFFDFKYHSYPNSIIKAKHWLNEGKMHYKAGDYKYASYCFGAASHYISDTFDGPHTSNIRGYDHILYEAEGSFLTPQYTVSAASAFEYADKNQSDYLSSDLNAILTEGYFNGKENWKKWIKTKDKGYIQVELNKATVSSYVLINRAISQSHFE